MGDPAGISGEIAMMAWSSRKENLVPPFFLIDDPARLEDLSKILKQQIPIEIVRSPTEAISIFNKALPIIPVKLVEKSIPGLPNPSNAPSIISSIDTAIALAKRDEISGIVTGPIHKASLYEHGFHSPGHTEYIAEKFGISNPVMMLSCSQLRVVPITVHHSIIDAVNNLTTEKIVVISTIVNKSLKLDFKIVKPRLAILGLNPHAGEDGNLGMEEKLIIEPAIEKLNQAGINAIGPLAPDSAFHESARDQYDVAICMIHDHALIPLKTLGFDEGINITLGLPIVRTSPDHGTAFNIAGTGKANPGSLVASIKLASRIADRRQSFNSQDVA